MKMKVLLAVLMLLTLFSVAAFAEQSSSINQNIGQNSSQMVNGSLNNSTINQSIVQKANQSVQGRLSNATMNQSITQAGNQSIQGRLSNATVNQTTAQNASQNIQSARKGNATINQSITQAGNQSIQGARLTNATINQSLVQSANQSIYFVMNTRQVNVTSEQKTVLITTTQQFLVPFPSMRMFIMPVTDLQQFVTAGRTDVVVVNVNLNGAPVTGFSNAIIIPLDQLTTKISEIPTGKTIAVVSDNDMLSAEAMTILRMQGFNAWAVKTGIC